MSAISNNLRDRDQVFNDIYSVIISTFIIYREEFHGQTFKTSTYLYSVKIIVWPFKD